MSHQLGRPPSKALCCGELGVPGGIASLHRHWVVRGWDGVQFVDLGVPSTGVGTSSAKEGANFFPGASPNRRVWLHWGTFAPHNHSRLTARMGAAIFHECNWRVAGARSVRVWRLPRQRVTDGTGRDAASGPDAAAKDAKNGEILTEAAHPTDAWWRAHLPELQLAPWLICATLAPGGGSGGGGGGGGGSSAA